MSLTMSFFTFYMFVYMYVHALTPPACGLSFICNKVLFCSVLKSYMLVSDCHKLLPRSSCMAGQYFRLSSSK